MAFFKIGGVLFGLMKIVSGGQTGADRAALDVALTLGFSCGGWCPEGRKAEDGPLPVYYSLHELIGAGYRQRTIRNIQDTDATAIFYCGQPLGGTKLTLAQCVRLHRPYQLIDAREVTPAHSAELLKSFIDRHEVRILNVAGPSARREPLIYGYVKEVLTALLRDCVAT